MGIAIDTPFTFSRAFNENFQQGILDSFGLGTIVRDVAVPRGNTGPNPVVPSSTPMLGPIAAGVDAAVGLANKLRPQQPSLTPEAYKTSPYYRDQIPWEPGMTEDRAASLAGILDLKTVRAHFSEKQPIAGFAGQFLGQAVDPINYIPIFGPLAHAAAVARFGGIAGRALLSASEATISTAAFGLATANTRSEFGDDVSWQAMAMDIGMSALIGGAFGGVAGVLSRGADGRARMDNAKNAREALIPLNEAIDGLANAGEVRLSPNGLAPVERVQQDAQRISDAPAPLVMSEPDRAAVGVRTAQIERLQSEMTGAPDPDRSAAVDALRGSIAAIERKYTPTTAVPERGVITAYHGTSATFDAFDVSKAGASIDSGKLGKGIYFSAREDVARGYGPNVRTERITLNNPIVIEGNGDLWDKLRSQSREWGISADPVIERQGNTPNPEWSDQFADAAKARGYDGVTLKFADGGHEYVVFDPSQINRAPATLDASPPHPDPQPEGLDLAAARVGKPEAMRELADQHGVDMISGDFEEQFDIDQMRAEGRLTAEDEAALKAADEEYAAAEAYGSSLKAAMACII